MTMYVGEYAGAWENLGLRKPGYYGLPSDHMGDVGEHIAQDPRFAQWFLRRYEHL